MVIWVVAIFLQHSWMQTGSALANLSKKQMAHKSQAQSGYRVLKNAHYHTTEHL